MFPVLLGASFQLFLLCGFVGWLLHSGRIPDETAPVLSKACAYASAWLFERGLHHRMWGPPNEHWVIAAFSAPEAACVSSCVEVGPHSERILLGMYIHEWDCLLEEFRPLLCWFCIPLFNPEFAGMSCCEGKQHALVA